MPHIHRSSRCVPTVLTRARIEVVDLGFFRRSDRLPFVTILFVPLLSLWSQPIEPPPRFERLASGLRVCLVVDSAVPLVSVQLWYRVGSADDPPHLPGLCHVLRTLLEHRERAALRARAAGLYFESRTLRDACSFETVLPADPEYLAFVLDLEAARMEPLTVTREALAEAMDAAVRCPPPSADESGPLLSPGLLAALLAEHPYRNAPGRMAGTVGGLSAEEAGEFLARWFVPGNATLLVMGDVQADEVLEMIRQRFGGLSPAEPPRRPERRVPAGGFATERIESGEESAEAPVVRLAWLTPPASAIENAALDVLMQRLCNPVDGPLRRRLSEAGFSAVRWRRESWREGGVLWLEVHRATAQSDSGAGGGAASGPFGDDVEQIVRSELERAAAERPAEIEFNRARNLAAGAVLEGRAGFAARARRLAEHEVIGGDILLSEFELPRLQRIPLGAMQSAARALVETCEEARKRRDGPEARIPPRRPGSLSERAGDGATERRRDGSPAAPSACAAAGELAPTEILDLLAASAPSLPPLEPPHPGPREANGLIDVTRTPGAELAAVVGIWGPRALSLTELRVRIAAGSTRHSAAELNDYLSYHAIRPASVEGAAALVGPKDRVAAMLELWGELLLEPDLDGAALKAACEEVSGAHAHGGPAQCADELIENLLLTGASRVQPETIHAWQERLAEILGTAEGPMFPALVLGDVDPHAITRLVGPVLRPMLRKYPVEAAQAGEREIPAPFEPQAWPGVDRPRVFWLPRRCGYVELRVAWPIDVEARANPDHRGAGLPGRRGAFAAALMGAVFDDQPAALDGRRTRAWRARVLPFRHFGRDIQVVVLSRRSEANSLGAGLAHVLARVRQIHDPRTPPSPAHTGTAMRLAVMSLRLRVGLPLDTRGMDDEATEGNPGDDHQAYWRDWLALSPAPQPIVVVVGGDEGLGPVLEKIGRVTRVGVAASSP